MNFFSRFVSISVGFVILLGSLNALASCHLLFEETSFSQRVMLNGGRVTDNNFYPIEQVLTCLELDRSNLPFQPEDVIVSVGEGMSLLVSTLSEAGFRNTFGLDPAYDTTAFPRGSADERTVRRFINQNRRKLLAGEAELLPLLDESVDVILSHKLVNNLDFYTSLDAFFEMIRVLKVGGEARVFGVKPTFIDLFQGLLRDQYRDRIELTQALHDTHLVFNGINMQTQLHLIRVRKLKPTQDIEETFNSSL